MHPELPDTLVPVVKPIFPVLPFELCGVLMSSAPGVPMPPPDASLISPPEPLASGESPPEIEMVPPVS